MIYQIANRPAPINLQKKVMELKQFLAQLGSESEENPLQTKKYKKSRRCRYFKMNAIEDQSSEKINEIVAESVQLSSEII